MNIVTEFDSDLLVDLSHSVYNELQSEDFSIHNGVGILPTYKTNIKAIDYIPWLTGHYTCITFEPGKTCPIHCDHHEGVNLNRSYNILVEHDGNNHVTRYYKYKHGLWDTKTKEALYNESPELLENLFEFTVKKPTLFYNQILHDVYNYGKTKRSIIMWLVDENVTDDIVSQWCIDNNIKAEVIFKCDIPTINSTT
jgi:hypothetical protein